MQHYTTLRDEAFIALCRHRAAELERRGVSFSIADLTDFVLANPAPSYFYHPDYAWRHLKEVLAGAQLPESRYTSATAWADIVRDVIALRAVYPGEDDRMLVNMVCNGVGSRPRFYISRHRALRIARRAVTVKSILTAA